MSENNQNLDYEDEILCKVEGDEVIYVDSTSDSKPIALVKNKGKSEYSIDSYYFLYKDEYIGPFDEIEQISSSKDNNNFLFLATKNDKSYIYLGKEMLDDSFEDAGDIMFAEEGDSYSYEVIKNNKSYVFINGHQAYGPFDSINSIIFPSRDKIYFFAKQGDVWDLYINGQEQKLLCDEIQYFLPVREGQYAKEIFYCIEKDEKWYTFFTDGRSAGPFDAMHFHIRHAEKSGDFAYVVINNGKCHLYRNNKKIAGPFLFIDYINFSPDEKNLIYVTKEHEGQYICIDRSVVAGPLAKTGFAVIISHDGKSIYYSSFQNGMWVIGHTYLDDEKREFHKDLTVPYKCKEIFHLGLLKTGNRIFYTTSSSNSLEDRQYFYLQGFGSLGPFILIESIATSTYDDSFAFSARTQEGYVIYLNGKMVAGPFDHVMHCVFYEDSRLFEFRSMPIITDDINVHRMIYIDGKVHLGFFDKRQKVAIYLKDGYIIKRTFTK